VLAQKLCSLATTTNDEREKQMEFFNTLPDELQKQATQAKMEELYDNWYDSFISEAGDEFANYVEEQLLSYLPVPIQQLATMFYEKQENANA
jgi:hypothetical protein